MKSSNLTLFSFCWPTFCYPHGFFLCQEYITRILVIKSHHHMESFLGHSTVHSQVHYNRCLPQYVRPDPALSAIFGYFWQLTFCNQTPYIFRGGEGFSCLLCITSRHQANKWRWFYSTFYSSLAKWNPTQPLYCVIFNFSVLKVLTQYTGCLKKRIVSKSICGTKGS